MVSLTREQVRKINSKCQNGFRLDVQTAVVWGKKELVKRRSIKVLQDLTANYPDEKAVSLVREAIAA